MNNAERMARANIDPETLKDMERACPTRVMRDIAMRDKSRAPWPKQPRHYPHQSAALSCQLRRGACWLKHYGLAKSYAD
jgi:hypothetical protein